MSHNQRSAQSRMISSRSSLTPSDGGLDGFGASHDRFRTRWCGIRPLLRQHIVRISEGNLSKGLVFGVLDVVQRQIIWLEMSFTSQTLRGASSDCVKALLHRLASKLTIGTLLDIKAKAQHLTLVEDIHDADEAYTYEWALNPADVTTLLPNPNS